MPIPDEPGVLPAYRRYWGPIAEAARSGWTTAQLWTAIRAAATESGMDSPGVSAVAVSRLRGIAGRMEAAAQVLQSVPHGTTLDARMIAEPPWARSLDQQATGRQYHVRYLSTVEVDGVESQVWRTIKLSGQPRTTSEIADAIDEAVGVNQESYVESFVNLDAYMLIGV